MNETITYVQAIAAMVSAGALGWVIRNLLDKNGQLAPRWYSDQERDGRLNAETRADKTLDVTEALLAELRKVKGAA
jgi:hypothetical protein